MRLITQVVERKDDMGVGVLRLIVQDDGDVVVAVATEDGQRAVEFCSFGGGGKSPHTLKALRGLVEAMERDGGGQSE